MAPAPDRDRRRNLRVWLRFEHDLAVKPKEVARLLERLDEAEELDQPPVERQQVALQVAGRDLVTGMHRTVQLTVAEVRIGTTTEVLPW